jgi:hypothetical protein
MMSILVFMGFVISELSEYAGEVSRLERELEQANIKAVELQKNVDATQEKAVRTACNGYNSVYSHVFTIRL